MSRDINLGDQVVRVRATPLALLYYKQAFKADLLGDMTKMQSLKKGLEGFDSVTILQMIWAMAKAEVGPGKSFPSFEAWLETVEIDFSDAVLMNAVTEEAMTGFFRGKASPRK